MLTKATSPTLTRAHCTVSHVGIFDPFSTLGIPFRGKKIEANIRNSVPKHVSDKNMQSILFGRAGFFVKNHAIFFRSEPRN